MNKKISSHWALGVIIALAIFSASLIWVSSQETIEFKVELGSKKNALAEKNECRARVFQGETSLEVWKVVENGKAVLRPKAEYANSLPEGRGRDFQLIDPTNEIEKKLDKSSEENPVTLKISGFATLCNDTSLAVLNYEEGVFKPYILN